MPFWLCRGAEGPGPKPHATASVRPENEGQAIAGHDNTVPVVPD